jgi:hypothetical protein
LLALGRGVGTPDRLARTFQLALELALACARHARLDGTRQQALDPRDQFLRRERLGQVVVGAARERLQPRIHVHDGGDHDDRHARVVGIPAQPLADLEPALLRQAHVEHDEIRTLGQHALDGGIAVRCREDAKAVGGERDLQQFEDAPVIVHEQDAGGRHRAARGRRTGAHDGFPGPRPRRARTCSSSW